MAQNIGNITTSQTFENWFTKTNDLVTALATNVMTASAASPETTNGDAILTGSFTATPVSISNAFVPMSKNLNTSPPLL